MIGQTVNVYSTDIRFAHIAEQKLHDDGFPVTQIEEWFEDGEQMGYRVHGFEHQQSRRVELPNPAEFIPVETLALPNFRRNVWAFALVFAGDRKSVV